MPKKLLFVHNDNTTNTGNYRFTYTPTTPFTTTNPNIQIRPVSFYCMNLFPNVTNTNDTFTYDDDQSVSHSLTLPVGNYSLTDFINYFTNNGLDYVYDNVTNKLIDGQSGFTYTQNTLSDMLSLTGNRGVNLLYYTVLFPKFNNISLSTNDYLCMIPIQSSYQEAFQNDFDPTTHLHDTTTQTISSFQIEFYDHNNQVIYFQPEQKWYFVLEVLY